MPKRTPIVPLPKRTPVAPVPKHTPALPAKESKQKKAAPAAELKPAGQPQTKKKRAAKASEGGAGPPARKARESVEDALPAAAKVAESRCWDPEVSHDDYAPRVSAITREPLGVEARRVAGLRRLRLSFGEATRKLQLPKAPLVGAFERWHFAWLLAATGPADPLLPLASSSAADAVLVAELEGAGATPA